MLQAAVKGEMPLAQVTDCKYAQTASDLRLVPLDLWETLLVISSACDGDGNNQAEYSDDA